MKKSTKYSLDELFTLSNEQILSKWSVFASFIRLYENGEQRLKDWGKKWHNAREKAIALLNSQKAEEYLNKARSNRMMNFSLSKSVIPNVKLTAPFEQIKTQKRSIYEINYSQLIKLIPNLENLIIEKHFGFAYANTVGFNGCLAFDLTSLDENKANIEFYHFVRDSDAFYVELGLRIRVNVVSMQVHVLSYSTNEEVLEVYHKVEGHKEELVNEKHQTKLNRLLKNWLKSMLAHKHLFIWDESEEADEELISKLVFSSHRFAPNKENELTEKLKNQIVVLKKKTKQKIKKAKQKQLRFKRKLNNLESNEIHRKEFERIRMAVEDEKDELRATLKNPNQSIPEFEKGEVQLTKIHKTLGITSEDIEAINSTKQTRWLAGRNEQMNCISYIKLLANGKVKLGKPTGNKIPNCQNKMIWTGFNEFGHVVLIKDNNIKLSDLSVEIQNEIIAFNESFSSVLENGIKENQKQSIFEFSDRIKAMIVEYFQKVEKSNSAWSIFGVLALVTGAVIGVRQLTK